MMKHTFILKFNTELNEWDHLSAALDQLCKDTDGGVSIFELNEDGKENAELIIEN